MMMPFVLPALTAVAGLAAMVLFPGDLALLARIAALALLVLSLDLVMGLGGVATLGQAALYGAGAYAAAIAATRGASDPLILLAIGIGAGACAGLISGFVLARLHGLAQLVASIALVELAHEAANKLSAFTGGSDGLTGYAVGRVFGRFAFDLAGQTAALLGLGLLVVVLALLGIVLRAPFGLACRAMRDDPVRFAALGGRVRPIQVALFALSGAVAGLGGAFAAISTGVIGLDSLSFDLSAQALVMLALGGAGQLWGAVIGTAIFLVAEQTFGRADPFGWLIMVGALMIGVALVLPGGLAGLPARLRGRPA
jgi:branched-chain amino acid transport system permease protein